MKIIKKICARLILLSIIISTIVLQNNIISMEKQEPKDSLKEPLWDEMALRRFSLDISRFSLNKGDVKRGDVERFIDSINNITDRDLKQEHINNAMCMFARHGLVEVVKLFINMGADVNARDRDDKSALISAAEHGNDEIVKLLISAGANVDIKNKEGYDKLEEILTNPGAYSSTRDKYGKNALIHAVERGHYEIAELLIAAGADIDARDKYGDTALAYALLNNHKNIIALLNGRIGINRDKEFAAILNKEYLDKKDWQDIVALISNGANIELISESKSNYGYSVVDLARKYSYIALFAGYDCPALAEKKLKSPIYSIYSILKKTLKLIEILNNKSYLKRDDLKKVNNLINSGAIVSAGNHEGMSALMVASLNGHTKAVKSLISAGVDINVQYYAGKPLLKLIKDRGDKEMLELLQQEKKKINTLRLIEILDDTKCLSRKDGQKISYLIKNEADINAQDKDGHTALMRAALKGNKEIAELLIKRHVELITQEYARYVVFGNSKSLEKILAITDINFKNKDGQTALMIAAVKGYSDIVEMLIKAKVQIDIKDKDGNTALMLAINNGHTNIVNLLNNQQL